MNISIMASINCGKPSIQGIRTDIIGGRFVAGESVEELAYVYKMPIKYIQHAIRYELAKARRLKKAERILANPF